MSAFFNKTTVILIILLTLTIGLSGTAHAANITTPSPLPTGYANVFYQFTLNGGGRPPRTWAATGLPSWLTLNATTGLLSGTPPAVNTYTFTVTMTDGNAATDTVVFSLPVVLGECSFIGTSTGSISFSAIDPSTTPGPITNNAVTQQVLFQCNTTVTYSIAMNPAAPSLDLGGNTIPFTLGVAAPGQNITNTTQIPLLTTASTILIANYQNAPAGLYASGNVLVTVSWTGTSTGMMTAMVTANGTILNICKVLPPPPGTLTFDINPSVAGMTSATISSDLQVQCTMNNNVTISAVSACGGASPKLDTAYPACGGSTINYTFSYLAGITGQGFGGAGIPLNISGSATSANYENAPVGSYGDLQTLTITY